MARLLKLAGSALLAILVWAVLVGVGTLYGWWRPMLAHGDTRAFLAAEVQKISHESKGNAALILLAHGNVAGEYFFSRGKPVDGATIFQVASLSKWFTAWGVMSLVEHKRIALDAPVSRYLKRWKLPPSEFDNNEVTIRRLLSHTAGLTDGLGYRGFGPGEKIQSLPDSLTHAADAMPFAPGSVRVGAKPGSGFQYSGGGYAVLQLLIEDVSGTSFNDYMRTTVLLPLGMTHSTFADPDPAHLAEFYGPNGERAIHYRFTVVSAASLYTSANDLVHFLQAQVRGPHGELPGRGVLAPATIELMRQPQGRMFGIPLYGLGTVLYARNGAGGYIVGHEGNNFPAINTAARVDPATGDGIVMLETGNGSLATEVGSDWMRWQTGRVDVIGIFLGIQTTLLLFASGVVVILLATALIGWLRRARGPRSMNAR